MKILHITPSYEPAWHLGGVVRSLSQLCRGLVLQGADVTVFTTDSGQDRRLTVPTNELVEVDGVKVFYFKTDFSLRYAYSRALRDACQKQTKNFDIVHATAFWCYPGIAAVSGAQANDVPYLLSVHGTVRKDALRHKFLKKWLYFNLIERRNIRGAAALHYTTALERELDAFHHFKNPSFIVPNGLYANEFQESMDRREAKKSWGIDPDFQTITFLGRLAQVKALDILIRAIDEKTLKGLNFRLLIAGPDGGVEDSLRQLVHDLGLDSYCRFVGAVNPDDRNSLLAATDVLALVSHNENFGIVAVEAMLAGVPVLVSEHVGVSRDIIEDGTGTVVPLRVDAISQALLQMLSNPKKLRTMGRSAAITARKRYDISVVACKMLTAYEDILMHKRSLGLSWSDGEQI